MNFKFERLKKMNKYILMTLIIFLIPIISLLLITLRVNSYGHKYIISLDNLPKYEKFDAILILGAGLKSDDEPSDILTDRLLTGIEAYKCNASDKFLLSGDHGRENYNEVKAMKKFLLDSKINVDESKIFLDHAGFSTYESIYRAKEVFKTKNLLIITNEYHLSRALYIARNLGIEAYGVPSDIRNYLNIVSYSIREKAAQIKDFLTLIFLSLNQHF